ncbi:MULTISPECIES: aminotransferase class V-fold PLP-dependent enzyme [unclassified Paenibacillus]|uniref:aminotransferase class V-fold PLP-dependent enzyme n=1 Tax=unclassified Paenibacillus TaxID=185978 RepID=UPI001AE7B938|nr:MULTISPECIES: aminotransferase class V-fold PLP-dependent enzyme [unclassified Paenibacillus]MBP1153262.1 cysteine desulfurase family protein [Paenibacillus sp. PvP091]MBP1171355.1 cysteine desulfurase family protein [Paenibacillus sp. PvR098]MBP2442383.1 cysteine desulfurase family protein [Paenibacillus sp. PvP052]
MPTIYLDHAASSWPKPPEVLKAMHENMELLAANPGRGSHEMAVKASRTLFEGRKQLAKLFHIKNPNDIAYALNTTMALNLAIKGFLNEGDHVICSAVEHNSVRRPLEHLKKEKNVSVSYIKTDQKGNLKIDDVVSEINGNTKMIVCSHSSNLLGSILPVAELGQICRDKGIKLLIDAAQTAGTLEIDVEKMGIHMLAFPGHKGLLGPQGTGGLYIHPDIDLVPLLHGGTGSQSEAIDQPTVRPDRYEAGTQNTVGVAGLIEGIKYIQSETIEKIHTREWQLTQRMMIGLMETEGVTVLGPEVGQNKTGIVSFTVGQADSSEIAFILDQSFQIAVRAGYHCTPMAHEMAGTMERGAIRASVGCFTTVEDVDQLIHAIREVVKYMK